MAQRQFRSDDTDSWQEGFGDGSDGAYSSSGSGTWSVANAGCSGTGGTKSVTLAAASSFADGMTVLIHQSRGSSPGAWELNKISSGGGGTSLTMKYDLMNTYADSGSDQAQMVEIPQYTSFTINTGHTISVPDWDGSSGGIMAILCQGTAAVNGTGVIDADSAGFIGGSGTADSSGAVQKQGEGESAAGSASQAANASGGGGGKDEYGSQQWTGGAGGGNGAAGSNATGHNGSPTSYGGAAAGGASLVDMVFGGAGGEYASVSGGDGGGIVVIIASDIDINSTITVDGGSSSGAGGGSSGGGGGAGGSVLLKGETIDVGTSQIACAAGSGGSSSYGTPGGNGAVGRIHADYSTSFTGTTSPTIDTTEDSTIIPYVAGGDFFLMF